MKRHTGSALLVMLTWVSLGLCPALADELKTTVKGSNVDDVTRDVAQWHDSKHADCKFVKVIGAEIVKREKDSVTEHWTIEACDKKHFTYSVYMMLGGPSLMDMVSDVESSDAAPSKR